MSKGNRLFSRFGVELEYMIVHDGSLEVAPVADSLLHGGGRARKNERRWEGLRISNELVLHVLEFKTDGPVETLEGLEAEFQRGIQSVNTFLEKGRMRLLPGAMHPWMDPWKETVLWPHGDRAIYETFDRLFDCRGHGWSNLQSTHLNLPFANEAEFVRLHEALRWVLPLVPALAASSPFFEGRAGGMVDHRLEAYRDNCRRIPSITARVVPERVGSIEAYREGILGRIAADLSPHDTAGILDPEWVNARGAIARFSRGTIEMRVMDVQECPAMDLAILRFVVALLRDLTVGESAGRLDRAALETDRLADLFDRAMRCGLEAEVTDAAWLEAIGLSVGGDLTLRHAIESLLGRFVRSKEDAAALDWIVTRGNLADRLVRAAGPEPTREGLREVYARLADCLARGGRFDPGP